jgi:GT2 family glycosyltransferase
MHNTPTPLVYFVILTWNQAALTGDCLASLAEQDYDNFHAVVVDNGSTDGSSRHLREAFPWACIITLEENIGYSPGNNVGIRYALQQQPDYIFLLNNDTVIAPDMLRRLVDVAESEADIGVTGPTMLYFDRPEIIWCAGNTIDWRNGETTRLGAESHRSLLDGVPVRTVDFISSCAVCIKRRVFETVGLLDERYFIYYEEADLSFRSAGRGWRTMHVPQALMWHKVSATMDATSPATEYYMNRNTLLFLSQHLRGISRCKSLARVSGRSLAVIAAYTMKPHGGARQRNRNARIMAIRDGLLGRGGRMGQDVAAICYPKRPLTRPAEPR